MKMSCCPASCLSSVEAARPPVVEGDRAFIGVQEEMQPGGLTRDVAPWKGAVCSDGIAIGQFDFEDIGAKIGQQLPALRHTAKVPYPRARECRPAPASSTKPLYITTSPPERVLDRARILLPSAKASGAKWQTGVKSITTVNRMVPIVVTPVRAPQTEALVAWATAFSRSTARGLTTNVSSSAASRVRFAGSGLTKTDARGAGPRRWIRKCSRFP